MPHLTALVASLPASIPFVAPEAQERAHGAPFLARLGANESVFGPSPSAVAAMTGAATLAWRYCDPDAHDLRAAIAARHGVAPANVMVGEGIDGLLGTLVRLLVEPGAPVVTSRGAYPTFNYHVAGFGGRLETVPYRDDAEDPQALLDAVRATGAKLVYLANPDNPMGGWLAAAEIADLVAGLPDDALLCLDEAYADFAPASSIPPIDLSEPRLIRMRTFSKAYGMAGARIGYALGETSLIAAFDRVRNHFGVNLIGQAGAVAALADQPWLRQIVSEVAAAKARIADIAAACGLRALPSATNFVAVDCCRDGAFARAMLTGLATRGVFVRMPGVAPLDRCIRITAGRRADLDILAEALPQALASA